MKIRIRATDNMYSPPNVAYLYSSERGWRCALASGLSAAFSYAGISSDEMACRFALEDCETPEQALAAVLSFARRYQSGPSEGHTVYDYELVA